MAVPFLLVGPVVTGGWPGGPGPVSDGRVLTQFPVNRSGTEVERVNFVI